MQTSSFVENRAVAFCLRKEYGKRDSQAESQGHVGFHSVLQNISCSTDMKVLGLLFTLFTTYPLCLRKASFSIRLSAYLFEKPLHMRLVCFASGFECSLLCYVYLFIVSSTLK